MQSLSSIATTRIVFVAGVIEFGGATTFLCNLAGELVRRKIPVAVMSFGKNNPMASDFARADVPVLCLDDRHIIFEDRLKTVLLELSRLKPSVVLATHDATSFEVLRYLPAGVFRIGVGQSDQASIYEMMRHYTPHMDLVAMVSQTMKQKAETMPEFAKVPVVYLRHGVPMPPDTELPSREFTKPVRILYHGRFSRVQKRVHLFPQILEQLKASGIPFHWTIAGDGPERNFLERTMSGSPEQTISFPGIIPYADVPELLRAHDICLLTSDHEGFGLSVLEAMGYGLVPVVSDLPAGIPEMVDKATGILVPMDDADGYARGIIHLHEHRDELAAKSAAARAWVQKDFTVEAMTDRWLAAFPRNSPPINTWPTDWKIKPMLAGRYPVYFSPPMRVLRRLAAKFRN